MGTLISMIGKAFGDSIDLGSNIGGITSAQDSACPTSDKLFKYWNRFEGGVLEPINSVSIQCV